MNNTDLLLLNTIKCYLSGDASGLKFSQPEVEPLCSLARIHKILPWVFWALNSAVQNTDSDITLPAGLREEVLLSVVGQTRADYELMRLCSSLNDSGVKYKVVKGHICRRLYRSSDMRISSDEDILVSPDSIELITNVLNNEKYKIKKEADNSSFSAVSSDGSLRVDFHTSAFYEKNERLSVINSWFSDVFSTDYIVDGCIKTLNDEYNLLYLTAHAFKHFIHSGFGIRQVADICVFVREKPQTDFTFVLQKLTSINALDFMLSMLRIGTEYLGFDFSDITSLSIMSEYDEVIVGELLDDIMRAGIYGTSSVERVRSARITLAASDMQSREKSSAGRYRALFPTYDIMARNYPKLNKHPVLLPLFWSRRILSFFNNSSRPVDSAIVSARLGEERVNLIKKMKISGDERPDKSVVLGGTELKSFIEAAIKNGGSFPLKITGSSMAPFLVSGRDSVILMEINNTPKKGDIILYFREKTVPVLHRVVSVTGGDFYMAGDAQTVKEGPVKREDMLAVAAYAVRKGRSVDLSSSGEKLLSRVWIDMLPHRKKLLRVYSNMRNKKSCTKQK